VGQRRVQSLDGKEKGMLRRGALLSVVHMGGDKPKGGFAGWSLSPRVGSKEEQT